MGGGREMGWSILSAVLMWHLGQMGTNFEGELGFFGRRPVFYSATKIMTIVRRNGESNNTISEYLVSHFVSNYQIICPVMDPPV